MASLNPSQYRLLERHVDRAIETLHEADRLLRGAVTEPVARLSEQIRLLLTEVTAETADTVSFALEALPARLVQYLDNPFAQGVAYNQFCVAHGYNHTSGARAWVGGNAAVAARNLPFLPPVYGDLWDAGAIDKTRLINIANRHMTPEAYAEAADWVRTRRKEDLDGLLLKLPATFLQRGRRGAEQAIEAAGQHGWIERFAELDLPRALVDEAAAQIDEPAVLAPHEQAARSLRAALSGCRVDQGVLEVLAQSPDPNILVERFLTGHRQSGDAEPEEITRTLFFAHAGPMAKLEADDKLLLRHFRPIKTQKRGQLFYRLLEVIEEALLERSHLADREARGIGEELAQAQVLQAVAELNKDPNRHLVVPDEWLGEVTRRHLYFGSRTRKDGAAYKWFRKMATTYYLGSHKTQEEVDERKVRLEAKAAARQKQA